MSQEPNEARTKYDVVIVGAGPVGQVQALLLAQRGWRVGIIERWPTPWPLPRACAIDHEALRVLQSLGLGDEVEKLLDKHGGPGRRMALVDADRHELVSDWAPARSDFDWPGHSSFFQPELETLLLNTIADHPLINLVRGWEVESLTSTHDGAIVTASRTKTGDGALVSPDQKLVFEGKYLIGADGANSIVSRYLGGDIHDLGFSFDWLVVDFRPFEPITWDPHIGQLLDPQRPTTFTTAGPNVRRFEFKLLEGEDPDSVNSPEFAWGLLQKWDLGEAQGELVRHAVYRFRGQWTEQWGRGRVLVAGDSAHLMPPFLGQGMCSGLRDAAAIAWRLDLILRGLAPESILESYQSERLPHVQQVITDAVAIGELISITDPGQAAERNQRLLQEGLDGGSGAKGLKLGWRLGPGLQPADDQIAGFLGVQGVVSHSGRMGRFDDVVGGRWQLLATEGDPGCRGPPHLGETRRRRRPCRPRKRNSRRQR
ncbi:bifunctional 3-(3-hydroxy-phenyl)propionate/3-hydroxycinnamic acid hydroxylase [Arthrobacter sp. MA-N2]|uniref:bifunctional 3-(3-hydroxy-phenyl)propionate/3-hydroxycinnamic acid hydroxylase n=1 Tax=Arthrobacter sp. MA-N2 TaxID=1101188 RepID=UPI0004B683E4|nr:bifunctional 3-(3-hydroxy-phenyl)propionate/3-hydroxycinnamic acid hydroxylase [Arthrobacter sp. MA-N2]